MSSCTIAALPAAHAVQLTCPSPSKPGWHAHPLAPEEETALAASHCRHAVAPVALIYLPASHPFQ